MMMQLKYHRKLKRKLEAAGDSTSRSYMDQVERLETEIGTYDGKGLDYDECIELIPGYIFNAVMKNDIKSVMDWLGSPVDKCWKTPRWILQSSTAP